MNQPLVTLPSQVPTRLGQALFGLFQHLADYFTGSNSADGVADTWTMAVNGSSASLAYVGPQIVDDVSGQTLFSFTHTVGVTDTTTTLHAASIVLAWNASEGRSYFSAANVGNTITFTGTRIGLALTIQESDSNLGTPSHTVTAGEPAAIYPGRLVIRDTTTAAERPVLKHPVAADFTAQVISLTFAGNTASYYSGTVWILGRPYSWGGVVWDTNLDTTCTAIAAAINAVMPANTVLAASVGSGGGVVTLTAEVLGEEFDATAAAVGHADAEATIAYTTGPSEATSLRRKLKGVPVWSPGLRARQTSGNINDLTAVYRAYAPVDCGRRGQVWVQSTQTIAAGDPVYVGTDTTAPGRFYNAGGANLVFLPPSEAQWMTDELSTNGQGAALLDLRNL